MRILHAGLLGWIGLVSVACDPGVEVRGVVRNTDGEPVEGAQVSLDCEDGDQRFEGSDETNERGFAAFFAGIGCLPHKCIVYATDEDSEVEIPVGDNCVDSVDVCEGACNVVEFDVKLPSESE